MGNCIQVRKYEPKIHLKLYFRWGSQTAAILLPGGISAHLTLPDAMKQLHMQLNLEPSQIISGFMPDEFGPVIPFFMLPKLPFRPMGYLCVINDQGLHHSILNRLERPMHIKLSSLLPFGDRGKAIHEEGLAVNCKVAAHLIIESMQKFGYARIRLDGNEGHLLKKHALSASQILSQFFSEPLQSKLQYRSIIPHSGKFVGYADNGPRQFYQVRRVSFGIPWPSMDAQLALTGLYNVTEQIARSAFKAICFGLGIDADHFLDQEGGLPSLQRKPGQSLSKTSHPDHFAMQPDTDTDSFLDTQPVEIGSSVLRVYQYFRKAGSKQPGLRNPATGLHADMGLLTVAPRSNLPGLMLLHPSGAGMIDVEREVSLQDSGLSHTSNADLPESTNAPSEVFVFAGETLGYLSRGKLKAPVHYVDERFMGQARISMPFFLRAHPDTLIDGNGGLISQSRFIESVLWKDRPWGRDVIASSRKPQDQRIWGGRDY